MVKKVKVDLQNNCHSIIIGNATVGEISKYLPKNIMTDSSSVHIFFDGKLKVTAESLRSNFRMKFKNVYLYPISVSESFKQMDNIVKCYEKLMKNKCDRQSLLVALGGGVIGDSIGFVAATFMRGISWISIPTTVLAQVDSGIGGKTGVNLPCGKNLVGAFWQPSLVVCDISFLKTLGKRDIYSGLGEIIKYALIFDLKFFRYIEKNWSEILERDETIWMYCIAKCAKLKANVIGEDERDLKGLREVLNFGHTFGHALEGLTDYGKFRHGEAVLWGMKIATYLSNQIDMLNDEDCERILSLISRLNIPRIPKELKIDDIMASISRDKKTSKGVTRFVLLETIGTSKVVKKIDKKLVRSAIDVFLSSK
ncbi:3-dehydroquinate synthase [Bacteriovoracaceae bacterium]|nr:3-dehydroquinate synthase [Bacteriovoracaceae bacterium]